MAFSVKKYSTNLNAARIVNNPNATKSTVKNAGFTTVYLNQYFGSVTDGGSDTVSNGNGYPLLPNETVELASGKFQINTQAPDASAEPATVWVVFS